MAWCLLSVSITAKIYEIPPELIKEVEINKQAFSVSPNSLDARFEMAMSYAYTGQIEVGWATLKELPKSYANTVIEKYEPLTMQYPTNWKYPFKLAFGYYFKENKDKAISLFELSYTRNPDNIWSIGFQALIKGEQGKVDEAILLCKQALEKEPNATAVSYTHLRAHET